MLVFTFLENTKNTFDRELFQNTKGHWQYYDKDKKLTKDISKAKYQKWVKL